MEIKSEKLKVLIVDDEPGMCLGAQRSLENFHVRIDNVNLDITFESEIAQNLIEYRQAMAQNTFALILLDYKLPDTSGMDILQSLVASKTDTLVIMMTAYATFETAIQATKLGAYDFLAKPFTPEELRNSVKKAVTRFILERETKKFEEEKKKIRFEFISVLSHELKSPLNAIEGYLRLLNDGSVKPDDESYALAINRSLVRLEGMRKLIFDILDMTRIESGQKTRHIDSIDLVEIAKASQELLEVEAKSNGITIEIRANGPMILQADHQEIDILFNNLLSNAVKYNRKNGKVIASISSDNDGMLVEIKDTGIGMSSQECAKLFNEFTRIKNEKTQNISGSGLGLSTVKKIVQLYGGEIKVESVPDEGTTFIIKLKNQMPMKGQS